MTSNESQFEMISRRHPCFSDAAHFKYGRIHLPVAPRCNIRCNFCSRSINGHEHRPGVTEKILFPMEAIERLKAAVNQKFPLTVAAVAGPAEPLANAETFEVFKMARRLFPDLIRCLATNGLVLAEKAQALEELGMSTITVTANAIDPAIGEKIYDYVMIDGEKYTGEKGAEILIEHQRQGVREAVARNMVVKINTVLIPGINTGHVAEIAQTYGRLGASIMNIIPLIPAGRFARMRPPTKREVAQEQKASSGFIEMFKVCQQCRADACGIPAIDRGGRFVMEAVEDQQKG